MHDEIQCISAQHPHLNSEDITSYLQSKTDAGMTPGSVRKYRDRLMHLYRFLPEDKILTAERLKSWRCALESQGYQVPTVQKFVTTVNTYLRWIGHDELCFSRVHSADLRGRVFGYLTAVEPTEKRNRADVVWRCQCRCGRETEVPATLLIRGNTTSCGCLNREILHHVNQYFRGTSLRQSLEDKPESVRAVSGYTGIVPKRGKWQAKITYKGIHYCLGTYEVLEDAVKARARAKELVMEDAARLQELYREQYGDGPVPGRKEQYDKDN